jgi:hypothetical protein
MVYEMQGAMVSAVSGTHVASFLGATFSSASQLGVTPQYSNFVSTVSDAMSALTNGFPFIEGVQKLGLPTAEVSGTFDYSPNAATGISGLNGPEGGRFA